MFVFIIDVGPLADILKNRDDGISFLTQRIFYVRWNFVIGFSQHNSVCD